MAALGFVNIIIMLICAQFGSIYVKHTLQNIKNDCHQWLSDISRVHQIRFRPGLCPEPRWGSLQRSPRPSWFKGVLLLREGRKGEERGGKRRGGEVKNWTPWSPKPSYAAVKQGLNFMQPFSVGDGRRTTEFAILTAIVLTVQMNYSLTDLQYYPLLQRFVGVMLDIK